MRLLAIILAVTGVPSAAGAINLDSSRFPAIRVRFDSEAQRPLAEAALGATEDAWQRQIVEWGLPVPWTGGDDGPVRPGVEVSIARTLAGAGGAMLDWLADVPSTPRCDCAVRVRLDDRQPDLAKVPETLFHEFNHAVVAGVDCTESPSVSEAFAVALQDAQFPGSTMVRGVVRQFQAFPEYPLDYWSMAMPCRGQEPCFPYQLGAGLFPIFLSRAFGGDVGLLREVLLASAQDGTVDTAGVPFPTCSAPNRPDWFGAVEATLRSRGSGFQQAFALFSAWRAVTGAHDDGLHFAHGADFAEPPVARVLTTFPVLNYLEAREYGTRYLEYLPTVADDGALGVTITGSAPARWTGSLLLWRPGGVQVVPLSFDAAGVLGQGETGSLAGVTRVLVAVSQLQDAEHATEQWDFDNLRAFKYEVRRLALPDAGVELDASSGSADAAAVSEPDAASAPDAAPVGSSDAALVVPGAGGCGCATSGAVAGPGVLVPLAWARRRSTRGRARSPARR